MAEHAYYPFGSEINVTPHEPSSEEPMKFTGHERDLLAGDYPTLDDMHARYYSAAVGRFFRADPVLGDPRMPQSWNRYSYTYNNPIRLTDPKGLTAATAIYSSDAFNELWIGTPFSWGSTKSEDRGNGANWYRVVWVSADGASMHDAIYLVAPDGKVLQVWEHNKGWPKAREGEPWQDSLAFDPSRRGLWSPGSATNLGSIYSYAPTRGISKDLDEVFKRGDLQCSDYSTLQTSSFVFLRKILMRYGLDSTAMDRLSPPDQVLPKEFPK